MGEFPGNQLLSWGYLESLDPVAIVGKDIEGREELETLNEVSEGGLVAQ